MGSAKSYETIWRHWLILRRIPRKTFVGTRDLQIQLAQAGVDVSLRTIQRDLIELSRLDFPLVCNEDNPRGWRWAEDARLLEIPGMDPFTALTFIMARNQLGALLPESCLAFLKPHLDRAREVLQGLGGDGVGGWPKKVARLSRHLALQPPEVDPRCLSEVYDSLLLGRQLEVGYRTRGAEEGAAYVVTPLGLVAVDATLYLVCNFADQRKVYKLALHRFERAVCLESLGQPIPEFDLQAYIADGGFEFSTEEGEGFFRARFDREVSVHLDEAPLSADQKLTLLDDGRVEVEATVRESAQLQWWLLGFGDKVEVLEPLSLRQQIAEICQRMSDIYQA